MLDHITVNQDDLETDLVSAVTVKNVQRSEHYFEVCVPEGVSFVGVGICSSALSVFS